MPLCCAGQLLIVMGVEGDNLTEAHKQFIAGLSSPQLTVQYRAVPDIKITNEFSPRVGLNWIKLNSWSMTQFATIINLDTGARMGISQVDGYRRSVCRVSTVWIVDDTALTKCSTMHRVFASTARAKTASLPDYAAPAAAAVHVSQHHTCTAKHDTAAAAMRSTVQ
jgi:hypothetical protein